MLSVSNNAYGSCLCVCVCVSVAKWVDEAKEEKTERPSNRA